ncbi:MAG: hypothetical protein ABSH12_08415, partial [Endomicrobiales bacterium]
VISYVLTVACEYINFFTINELDRKKIWIIALYPLIIILKDMILGMIYFAPFISSTVQWRGRIISIGRQSKIIEREMA